MEQVLTKPITKNKKSWFSLPLFKQSLKANFPLWLALTIGSAAIFIIINLVVGSKRIFTNIDMNLVQTYVEDQGMNWLQILGLLETMGFSLTRIQTMSQIDINSVMNDLVYKIAGVMLPMIYVMIVCNKLLASQVNDGSMAYILSTPTNRKKVLFTQYSFVVLSLLAMYVVVTLGAFISGTIAYFISMPANLTYSAYALRTLLYCFASFIAIFGLAGICFGASAFFNKSSYSLTLGGGVCIISFLCCILGLFGNKVFVSVGVGVEAMRVFDFMTLFSLIDTESMSNFAKAVNNLPDVIISFDWIYKLIILFVIGITFSFIGSYRFVKKDLPL